MSIIAVGDRFGRLVVVGKAPTRNSKARWYCRCDCGNEVDVECFLLRSGNTKSCGCYRRDLMRERGQKSIGNVLKKKYGTQHGKMSPRHGVLDNDWDDML